MQDFGMIKSVIELIEGREPSLRQKVVTGEHYELAEPYVCLRVLRSQTDQPTQPQRAKITLSLEVLSKYSGVQEITQLMHTLQTMLNQAEVVNVHGEARLAFVEAKVEEESDGRRRGTQVYEARVKLHGIL